jgi:hypothetical protein
MKAVKTEVIFFQYLVRKSIRSPGYVSSTFVVDSVVVEALSYKLEGRGFKT